MRLSLILLILQVWANIDVCLSQNECSTLPDVPHAAVSDDTKQSEYQLGHVIHFTCETGYISGPVIRYVCTSGGWLAVRKGSCYLKPCELPDETPNGFYLIIKGEEFVFGTTIKYFCNEGYHMVSRDDTRTCYLDKWSNHVPICSPLSCVRPPSDERMTVTGLPDNDDPILPDRFLTFSCDSPGQYLNGSSRLICGKDGKWDNLFPSCEDVTCSVAMTRPHLQVVGLPAANKTIQAGQKVQFVCADEYLLDGSKESECLVTGEWSNPFPTCIDSGCTQPPPLADGDTKKTAKSRYRNSDRVEYMCQNYYIMEGRPYKTCRNGEWIGEMRCLKPCTVNHELMQLHNIQFRYSRKNKLYSEHNDVIEFLCTNGNRPTNRLPMRQRCVDGVMNLPSCA